MDAAKVLNNARELLLDRAKERDTGAERSMERCVKTFNAMTGHGLSTEDGWQFMVYLKHSRMRGGSFKQDDYEDAVAYEALMAEEAELSRTPARFVQGKEVPQSVPDYRTLGQVVTDRAEAEAEGFNSAPIKPKWITAESKDSSVYWIKELEAHVHVEDFELMGIGGTGTITDPRSIKK